MRSIPVLFLVGLLVATSASAQRPSDAQTHWVGTWGASPSPQFADAAQMNKASLLFANQTVREIVHVSVGGSLVRVRLSNAYGKQPVEIGGARIVIRQQGSAIVPGSDHALTFSGQSTVIIPPDALVLSDAVEVNVLPASDLAISLFLPKSTTGAEFTTRRNRRIMWRRAMLRRHPLCPALLRLARGCFLREWM